MLSAVIDRVLGGPVVPDGAIREGVVMGTLFRVEVAGLEREEALAAAEDALREVERLDRALTTWDPSSPMSLLNQAAVGRPSRLEAKLFDLLVEAGAWSGRTGGTFDATIGALVDAWGLRGAGARPDGQALASARCASGGSLFTLDRGEGTLTRHHPRAWIDTDGFGKGAALKSAGERLSVAAVDSAFMDLGGQVLAIGRDPATRSPWRVGVAHPRHRQGIVARLLVEDASVATSGNSERARVVRGEPIGHLIDPRTGHPAALWGSVTVVADDPMFADVLSTALYVMGPVAGLAWSKQLDDVGALFVVECDGSLVSCCNTAMERWLVDSSVPLIPEPPLGQNLS